MISVVLPAYNEEKNIGFAIEDIADFLVKKNLKYEIIAVDDGSKDTTAEVIKHYEGKKNVILVSHPSNMGYGAALRSGFKVARGDLIFFTDSDRQFNIEDIEIFLEKIKGFDFVVGYRENRQDPVRRILYAKIFRFLSRIFFGIEVRDIDCAFKLFRGYVLSEMNFLSNGALINLEIFALAKKKGYKFAQFPVRHFKRTAGEQTGGNFKVIGKAMFNFFRLWLALK
jgi:glycosyltransferase involved in cell wall biosynthesis